MPGGLAATPAGPGAIDLRWAAATDDTGVAGYTVYRDGAAMAEVPASTTALRDMGLGSASVHLYAVDAHDGAGNRSAPSAPVAVVLPDTAPPGVPGALTATPGAPGVIELRWRQAGDDVGVVGYTIYRDDVAVASVPSSVSEFADGGLGSNATHRYAVDAVDAAGNHSARSAPVVAVASDTAAPTTPGGLEAAPAGATEIDLAWDAASDDVGVARYTLYRDGAAVANVPALGRSFADRGLAPATSHRYALDAVDAAGNRSARSASVRARTAAVAGDPVIAAAGDIACDPASGDFNGGAGAGGAGGTCQQRAVSDLLVGAGLQAVLLLGDNAYYCGSLQSYHASFDPSWGRVLPLIRPVPGNHEYLTSGAGSATGCDPGNADAAGYFTYFGAAAGAPGQGWYSFDVGAWHVIALNSQCGAVGGCTASSPQGAWLAADLAAHPNACTLAYWHIPLFSSGGRAAPNTHELWGMLWAAGADVVLNGHDHVYERFAPQTPDGLPDPVTGIREFIAGTGGANHTAIEAVAANSQVRDSSTYGVLKLTLQASGYSWRFVPQEGGSFTDAGSASCH